MTLLHAVASVAIASVLCFLLKGFSAWWRGEGFRPFGLGGMPSAHATAVGALTMAVLIEDGWSILLLAVAVFSILFVRDACGVRWEVTKHSEALNTLTRSKRYVRTGHTRLEAALGVVLGVVVTLLTYFLIP